MSTAVWPQSLQPVEGPFRRVRIDGASAGMGAHGPVTQALLAAGHVSPDLVCGMTLFLLAKQKAGPQDVPASQASGDDQDGEDGKASPIAGGVWVREQFTIHRPLAVDDVFTVTGSSTGRFVRKGRRYGTTRSQSHDAAGRLIATNLTNGLLAYAVEAGVTDHSEGLPLDQTPSPDPDWERAAENPHLDAIRSATVGQRFGGDEMEVSLAMMTARDTSNPDNPIHSDPEAARKAGLERPIAGGSHVLAFAIEPLLAAWGPGALSHGAKFDVSWKAPTKADTTIMASAVVTGVAPDQVDVGLEVVLAEGPTALVGTLTIPLPRL
ncbi:MAG: MaoC family dehydratase [Actinomycetia bacterium]|nr:MaoC family dehydratase [Actinomycetes bacterium]